MSPRMFEAVCRMHGKIERIVTDRYQVNCKEPPLVVTGETLRFRHDGDWVIFIVAPLVEPLLGRRTRYPVVLTVAAVEKVSDG